MNSTIIGIEGMEFYARHGYYATEQVCENRFSVDVYVQLPLDESTLADTLEGTVNYETVFTICRQIMDKPVKLLETVAFTIAQTLQQRFPQVAEVRVRVSKWHIPGNLNIARTFVEVKKTLG
ncbi:dihydroneopterin aldolase [Sphingobacteriales bacterium UPWRP_1]|nr:dihydroneopterin aldolase [Sphingobacteriales bacterium TSM_CSM]PSJ78470.1 dihydroneopterin aldolase [Sphingobacteriales bacterium UPWRP_1]